LLVANLLNAHRKRHLPKTANCDSNGKLAMKGNRQT